MWASPIKAKCERCRFTQTGTFSVTFLGSGQTRGTVGTTGGRGLTRRGVQLEGEGLSALPAA